MEEEKDCRNEYQEEKNSLFERKQSRDSYRMD
jgi:hypothetical protein